MHFLSELLAFLRFPNVDIKMKLFIAYLILMAGIGTALIVVLLERVK